LQWEARFLTKGDEVMKSKQAHAMAIAVLALSTLVPAATCAAQGVVEKVGQGLDNAGRTIRRGVENAVARSQEAIQEQNVLGRVYSRLHWDKVLAGSILELEVRADGTVFLRGSVVDVAAKKRAVLLASDTIGVSKVVDELAVPEPVNVVPAAEPAKPSRVLPKPVPPPVTTGTKIIIKS
jgi:hyperosmotically inducible protein